MSSSRNGWWILYSRVYNSKDGWISLSRPCLSCNQTITQAQQGEMTSPMSGLCRCAFEWILISIVVFITVDVRIATVSASDGLYTILQHRVSGLTLRCIGWHRVIADPCMHHHHVYNTVETSRRDISLIKCVIQYSGELFLLASYCDPI